MMKRQTFGHVKIHRWVGITKMRVEEGETHKEPNPSSADIDELRRRLSAMTHRLQEITMITIKMEMFGTGVRGDQKYDDLNREYDRLVNDSQSVREQLTALNDA
ncbi:hypothetical protein [Paraburkholderia sp. GAS42]|uniref:hypothetical protein n=1 Tax=Paraburkholderia sp. GAS42 TaxID=3035135 RepID=UPI003D1C7162